MGIASLNTKLDQTLGLLTSISEGSREAREEVQKTKRAIDDLGQTGPTLLDDLLDRVRQFEQNAWADEMEMQLQLVKLGMKDLDDFLTMWGDTVIQVEDGSKRVRELLQGMDLDIYQDKLRDLMYGLQEGTKTLDDVAEHFRQAGGVFAEELSRLLEAFRKGEITAQRLKDAIEGITDEYSDMGTDFGDFADTLINALDNGSLP